MPTSTAFSIWNALDTLSTLDGIVHLLVGAAIGLGLLVLFLGFFLRKEIRLFRNRRRPIKIFCAEGVDVGAEVSMLRKSKLFNIENPTTDYRQCSEIDNHSLVIIAYTPKMNGFSDIIAAVRAAKTPVIVYTKVQLDEDDKKLLGDYPWHSVCNFPLKLMNDTFTILSTFPKMK